MKELTKSQLKEIVGQLLCKSITLGRAEHALDDLTDQLTHKHMDPLMVSNELITEVLSDINKGIETVRTVIDMRGA